MGKGARYSSHMLFLEKCIMEKIMHIPFLHFQKNA